MKKNPETFMNDKLHGITMTDDIVTRLRGLSCPECGLPSTHNHFDEAADEIERLRKELQIAHSEIAMMATAKVEEEPF